MRLVCALLLVLAGMAHRPIEANAAVPDNGYAYMLPDGSVPDICVSADDGSKPVKHVDRECEACRISAGVMMPQPPLAGDDVVRIASSLRFSLHPEAGQRLLVPPGARPRGPPLFLADI